MSRTAKIAIHSAKSYAGGASSRLVGTAMLNIDTFTLGTRLTARRCGSSRKVINTCERVQTVTVGGIQYVVEKIEGEFSSDIKAREAGCEFKITIDEVEGIKFETDPPTKFVKLIEDFR